ncbi:MAG: hypothetical protein K9G34_03010, partial [Melioribacteraceae bacterium]|nr:hypothetical protein [Melioribacteraceae bacterium]
MNIIKIDSISHGNDGHKLQFVVNVNSKRFDVYFKCRGATLAPTTEAFIGILLLPAMLSNSKIIIEGEVDEKFYNQLPLIQSIYKQWFPSRNFQQVEIENVTPVSTTVDTRSRTATFFSGGIDSYYTFKKKDEHITDFVFIKGFDIGLSNTFLLEKSSALIYESAKRFNKSVIEIDTNVKLFLNKFVGIKIFHGALLSAIGHLLSKEIGRIYIPS